MPSRILKLATDLRAWFTRDADAALRQIDGLDIGWGGVQRRATARMIDSLTDADRFGVLAFDHQVEMPPVCGGGLVAPGGTITYNLYTPKEGAFITATF